MEAEKGWREMNTPRALAIEIVNRVLEEGAYLHLLLRTTLARSGLDERDRALVTELATGTVRMLLKLDYALSFYLDRDIKDIEPVLMNSLRLGAYQLIEMKTPRHAAVHETVEASKKYLKRGAVRYLNAVLRAVAGDTQRVIWPKADDFERYVSITQSHPLWMVTYLKNLYGEERALRMCRINNSKAPLDIRVNTMRNSLDEFISRLKDEEVEFSRSRYIPEGLTNLHMPSSYLLEGWERGDFVVQDESSMLVSYILAPRAGEFIIDACSAPGGKTSHIAQLCRDEAKILAIDNQPKRQEALKKMVKNLGLKSITCKVGDSQRMEEFVDKKADRILVDAPCSGLGTLRRRPDMKWKRKLEDIGNLAAVQANILNSAARVLKKDGVLVYSVCTITKEETEDVVERFLSERRDFLLEDARDFCPMEVPHPQENKGFIFLFPELHHMDGMFIARLRKC